MYPPPRGIHGDRFYSIFSLSLDPYIFPVTVAEKVMSCSLLNVIESYMSQCPHYLHLLVTMSPLPASTASSWWRRCRMAACPRTARVELWAYRRWGGWPGCSMLCRMPQLLRLSHLKNLTFKLWSLVLFNEDNCYIMAHIMLQVLCCINPISANSNLYIKYQDRKGCISAACGCFQIVNILYRSGDIAI